MRCVEVEDRAADDHRSLRARRRRLRTAARQAGAPPQGTGAVREVVDLRFAPCRGHRAGWPAHRDACRARIAECPGPTAACCRFTAARRRYTAACRAYDAVSPRDTEAC